MNLKELKEKIAHFFKDGSFIDATFSSPWKQEFPKKVVLRSLHSKKFQISETIGSKVHHRNVEMEEILSYVGNFLIPSYKQGLFFTKGADFHLLTNGKGKITFLKKKGTKSLNLSHNREKKRLIEEDAPFLKALGITKNKYKQVNRFLELVEDVLPHFNEKINIVDFGCGKAYLTFALYYYLKEVKKLEVTISGIDIKLDVISFCQKLAQELKFSGLSFSSGPMERKIDMLISLHACNTATDMAIAEALRSDAKVILVAPCCQQELYHQIENPALQSLLQHGVIKERLAALATDALRADFLEARGYKTQVIEFVDPEHTFKNILIRAVRQNNGEAMMKGQARYEQLKSTLNLKTSLDSYG